MELISSADGLGGGKELTGPNDPLRLTAWHKLDQQASLVTMQFEAYNQLSFEVQNVTIRYFANLGKYNNNRLAEVMAALCSAEYHVYFFIRRRCIRE